MSLTNSCFRAVVLFSLIITGFMQRLCRLHAAHADSIIKIFQNSFAPSVDTYSWGRPFGYSDEGFLGYVGPMVKEFFLKPDGHDAIGFVDENNVVTSFLLMEPFGSLDKPDEPVGPSNPISPMYRLLNTCRQIVVNEIAKRPSLSLPKCSYISWMATDPNHRRKGYSLDLVKEATNILSSQNYDYCIAYCTSPKSRQVFLKAGYELWGEINYTAFDVDGEHPFAPIPDEVSIVAKRLK